MNFHPWHELNFHTLFQASECLLRLIFLSGQFVRSGPAVLTELNISVTGPHSTYRVKWNKKVMYQLCVTVLQMQ